MTFGRVVTGLVLAAATLAGSGCAVYGHHGRVRVGVALPPIVIPIPVPRHQPQAEYPSAPQPAPPAPPPASAPPASSYPPDPAPPPPDYPSAGGDPSSAGTYPSAGPDPSVPQYGAVRSLASSPHRGMVRVGVLLENRVMRYVDLPGTNLRIGERVRLEGDRIYRVY